jgi:hypothetical protein
MNVQVERETPLKKSKSTDIENKLKCWAKGEKENSLSISEREREKCKSI